MWRIFHDLLRSLLDAVLASAPQVVSISSRVKSLESIQKKLEKKKLTDIESLKDMVGFRIVVENSIDIKPVYDIIALNFSILEFCLYTWDGNCNISSQFPASEIRRWNAVPSDAAYLVIAVNESRAKLPEWVPYRLFHAEVQIYTAFGNAWIEAEEAWRHKGNSYPAPLDIANLKVEVRLSTILKKFERLVDLPEVHEKRDIHPFLFEHTFVLHPNPQEVFSEVAIGLGTQYRIDFLIRESDGSYLLVELENVKHKLFTKSGDFSHAVNHAQRQVEDWQQWIEENLPTVQKEYPDIVSPKGLIIIGRTQGLSDDEKLRLVRRNINLHGRLAIWTYDDLINNAYQFIESLKKNLQKQ